MRKRMLGRDAFGGLGLFWAAVPGARDAQRAAMVREETVAERREETRTIMYVQYVNLRANCAF
jgi:hypothetical protein